MPFFSINIEKFIFFKSLRIKFSLIFKKLLKEIQTKFSTNKKTSNIMTYEFHKFNYSNTKYLQSYLENKIILLIKFL